MKKILIINLCLIVFLSARPDRDFKGDHKNADMIKRWKLIEYLDLNEEQSNQFFLKLTSFKKNMKEMRETNKKLHEEIRTLLENDNVKKNNVDNLVNEFFDNESKILELKRNHHLEVQQSLNSEQTIKYLVFDRKFKKNLKEKLFKRGENHKRKD